MTNQHDIIGDLIGEGEQACLFRFDANVWSETAVRAAVLRGYEAGKAEASAASDLYRHVKSGRLYLFIAYATDSTNARHGADVVVYSRESDGAVFVRDADEFREKFEPIDDGSKAVPPRGE